MNTFFKMILASSVLLVLSGCATYGAAKIESTPPGAEVFNIEDQSLLGTTPVIVHWKADREESRLITVKFRKNGYQDKVTAFWVNMRHSSRASAEKDPQDVTIELKPRNP